MERTRAVRDLAVYGGGGGGCEDRFGGKQASKCRRANEARAPNPNGRFSTADVMSDVRESCCLFDGLQTSNSDDGQTGRQALDSHTHSLLTMADRTHIDNLLAWLAQGGAVWADNIEIRYGELLSLRQAPSCHRAVC